MDYTDNIIGHAHIVINMKLNMVMNFLPVHSKHEAFYQDCSRKNMPVGNSGLN